MINSFSEISMMFNILFGPIIAIVGIIAIIPGLLYCFFGYKIVKIGYAVMGFIFGLFFGTSIAVVSGFDTIMSGIIGIGFAIIFAFLLFKLYKFATFFQVFLVSTVIFAMLTQVIALAVVIGIVLGVLAVLWIRPSVILSTAFIGALLTSNGFWLIFNVRNSFLNNITVIIMFVLGVYIQWKQSGIKVSALNKILGENGEEDNNQKLSVSDIQNLGMVLGKTSQNALRKTKEMAEIVKINTKITEEKKKINQNLLELGKLCYDSCKNLTEVEYATLAQSIDDSNAAIDEYKKQIDELRQVNTAVITQEFEENTHKCNQCGFEQTAEDLFCNSCGSRID